MGKVNLLSMGKVWETTEISHILRYLAYLELMKIHAIPNVWECANSHKMEIFCGSHIIPSLRIFQEIRSYYKTRVIHRVSMGNVKFHAMGILWGQIIYFHTMGFE